MKVLHYKSIDCLEPQIWTAKILKFSEVTDGEDKELISEEKSRLGNRRRATKQVIYNLPWKDLAARRCFSNIQPLRKATLIHHQQKTRLWKFENIWIIKFHNYATHIDARSGLFGLFGGALTSTGCSSGPKPIILERATSSSVAILILPNVAFLLEISFFRFHNFHNPIAMSTTDTTPIAIPTMTAVGKQSSQWSSAIGVVALVLDALRVGVVYWVAYEVDDELVKELSIVGTMVDFSNAVVEILELLGGGASLNAAAW
jgi:hypothetical protein